MKVSVVIPSFGRPALLQKSISSLGRQHFTEGLYEIIVVIDGPDQASRALLSQWSSCVKYKIHSVQKGPAAARNTGWRAARGELVIFIDDDCIAADGFIEAYWQAYKKANLPLCAFSGKTLVPLYGTPTDYEKNVSKLQSCEFITANCACNKKALEKINGFDEQYKMAWREDSDLHFSFLQNNIPVIVAERALISHPVRKCRWGISLSEKRKSMYNALLYKKFPLLYRSRISGGPSTLYLWFILSFTAFLLFLFLREYLMATCALTVWLILYLAFLRLRLKGTTKNPVHVAEMIVTSLCIPFLSVYWTIRGAIQFKVFFI